MVQDPNCLFCKIVSGEVPNHTVWESETHLAFLTIFPNTEGVTVVISKNHLSSYIFDQSDSDIQSLMIAAKTVAKKLDTYYQDSNRCGVVFEGFGVDHLHAKLYPLHGTGNLTEWKNIESGPINTYFETYPGYISSNDSLRAEDSALAALAEKIRNT